MKCTLVYPKNPTTSNKMHETCMDGASATACGAVENFIDLQNSTKILCANIFRVIVEKEVIPVVKSVFINFQLVNPKKKTLPISPRYP